MHIQGALDATLQHTITENHDRLELVSLAVDFFLSQMKRTYFSLHFPCFPTLNIPHIFFVRFFLHFSFSRGVHTTVFTEPDATRDLFDVQTSAGACWKDNELQSACALSEFRQMALQVRPERASTCFGTTLVHFIKNKTQLIIFSQKQN